MRVGMMYKLLGCNMTSPRAQAWGMIRPDGVVFLTCWRNEVEYKKSRVPVLKAKHYKPERDYMINQVRKGATGFVLLAERKIDGGIDDVQDRLYGITGIEVEGDTTYALIEGGWIERPKA